MKQKYPHVLCLSNAVFFQSVFYPPFKLSTHQVEKFIFCKYALDEVCFCLI